jgi:hypothetical protein
MVVAIEEVPDGFGGKVQKIVLEEASPAAQAEVAARAGSDGAGVPATRPSPIMGDIPPPALVTGPPVIEPPAMVTRPPVYGDDVQSAAEHGGWGWI